MAKKLLLVFVVVALCIAASEKKEWAPWVKTATQVCVVGMQKNHVVNITDAMRIGDIKNQLNIHIGLHPDDLLLLATYKSWWTLKFIKNKSSPLDNDQKIKDVMNAYATDCFEMICDLEWERI